MKDSFLPAYWINTTLASGILMSVSVHQTAASALLEMSLFLSCYFSVKGMFSMARLTMKSFWEEIKILPDRTSLPKVFFLSKANRADPDFPYIYSSKLYAFLWLEISRCTILLPLLGPTCIFPFQLHFLSSHQEFQQKLKWEPRVLLLRNSFVTLSDT